MRLSAANQPTKAPSSSSSKKAAHGTGQPAVAVLPSTRRQLLSVALTAPALAGMQLLAGAGHAHAKAPAVIDIEKGLVKGERDVKTLSSGIKLSEVSQGSGPVSKTGDLVLVDVVGRLDNGQVFLDTKALGTPLAFQIGTTNKFVPEGLGQVVEGMAAGSVRLAVLPPEVGYGDRNVKLPNGTVPPNSILYYEVELLRCEEFTLGLACCSEAAYNKNGGSCVKNKDAAAAAAAAAEGK